MPQQEQLIENIMQDYYEDLDRSEFIQIGLKKILQKHLQQLQEDNVVEMR